MTKNSEGTFRVPSPKEGREEVLERREFREEEGMKENNNRRVSSASQVRRERERMFEKYVLDDDIFKITLNL